VLDRAIDALMRLHQADVLHRDIKPSNILVDQHGDVWLTDFGLSRFSGHAAAWAGTVGTPGYMSPEQWDDQADVDGRADVFSLGVTAYQALTLELPYARKRITARTAVPAPPSKRNPLVTERLDAVIAKAIHPDRTQRYQSAAELKEAWERARRKPSEPSGWWRRANRRKRATAVAALTLSLLLLVAGTAWLASLWAGSGGGKGGPEPPHNVIVHITTDPPGAQVVFVPLHPDTGEPQGELAVRPPQGQITPVQIELAPGPYFVEAQLGKGRFHQVYRQVPLPGKPSPGSFPHLTWVVSEHGSIE
jgi:serine/threonine-protein kinase